MKFLLGKKLGMTQVHKENNVIPVTLIESGPNFVTQIKTKDKDGYNAIQIGFQKVKENKIKKSQKNKLFKYLRESKKNIDISNYKISDEINVSTFAAGDKVNVVAVSKGKGFQGVVKRHGFAGGPKSHGQKDRHRAPGSIGASWPQHVIKGMKMAGRMGGDRITVKNLEVIEVDGENNLIAVKGAIPGRKGTLVMMSAR